MSTQLQFKLRYNKAGKLLTQIHHYGDFTVLVSRAGIMAHYQIKQHGGTRMWGFDLVYSLDHPRFISDFRQWTCNKLSNLDYEHLAKQILVYRLAS